jgi:SAM-dependent methyltransferase
MTLDPTETSDLFDHHRVAEGYASARPYLHPEVLARVSELIGRDVRVRRALDVGCGTGLSSVALRALAAEVVGFDAALAMLVRAMPSPGVSYVAAEAEALPFGERVFDLVLACGSMDWIDRPRFMPQARDLTEPGGWFVSLDFGDAGRSPEMPGLSAWYRGVFQQACPCPPARDPIITPAEASTYGFDGPLRVDFTLDTPFTVSGYAAFLMTESSVVAVVEYGGRASEDVRAWLETELEGLFGGQSRLVTFGGYIQAMRRRGDKP